MDLDDTSQNQIGDALAGGLNVISANGMDGITVENQSQQNTIRNNNIGIGPDPADATVNLGNTASGVAFNNSRNNVVKSNRISHNSKGVVNQEANKVFDPNSIFGNGYGIDNGDTAGTPVLTSAVAQGPSLVIQGTLASTPSSSFLLEFFANPTSDPVGHEQGKDYLGNLTVTTDDAGNAVFSTSFPNAFPADINVSATATGVADDGWTSEFSNEEPITPQPTGTILTSSVNPSMPGQAVTFTATVEGGYQPTGTVSFYDGTTLLGTGTLANSQATFTTSSLTGGTHSITAVYSGDPDNSGSTSSALSQTVQLASTGVYLSSSANPSPQGQPVTFTAIVEGGYHPTGTVSFYDGSTLLGTVTPSNSEATFTTSSLSSGTHDITAVYSGDADNDGSTSSPLNETID